MTGLLHERELSRKQFLAGGGALIVSVGALAGSAQAATGVTPFAQRGAGDFLPNLNSIDAWLAITADNKAIVTHGETELGHGTPTGILMLVAEELDMGIDQMIYAPPETWLNATGGGGGSGGISQRSTQTRAAAAYAKKLLLDMASKQLGVPASSLTVDKGVVSGGGKTVTYGQLIGGKSFNYVMPATQTSATPGQGIAKPVKDYKVVGRVVPRIDIPAKVMGTYTYVHNVRVPGMVHARIVRPHGAGANTSQNHFPLSVDPKSIAHIPGAQIVQVNNFLAVVAPREYDAIQAAAQLKVVWKSDPKLSGSGNYWSWMRQAADTNTVNPPRYTADSGAVPAALASAAKTVSATYRYHYNGHMPIGPQCAVADVRKDGATVFMSGQSINTVPQSVSEVLAGIGVNLEPKSIRVIFREGSSSYGTGQLTETCEAAAICSAKVGAPVRMQWMRWDQHGWDPFGPSHMYDVTMGADATGKIVAADWTSYGQASTNMDTTRELMGIATWAAVPGNGGPTPSDSAVYNLGYQRRVLAKTQPLYGGSFRNSALRAPNAPQSYFASEQVVDELAHALNMDPIAFRRRNIDGTNVLGARWLSVLDAATIAAGWKPKVAASNLQKGDVVTGRGFGFGTFASSQSGVVADIEVNKKTGKIVVKHLYISQNNGITIGPDLVANQMSGAAIQGLSRALYEQVTFDRERVTSTDWVTYPILRFKDCPKVTLVNVHPGHYTVVTPGDKTVDVSAGNTEAFNEGWSLSGSGEPPTTAVSSAVANAFFDATGVRIRQAPMNPATVRQVLKDAGVA
ncbi:MAG TPA: molybdopterin cofactor-binding domain-containing protein [Gaiellaceae bacterium]|nr:molybdopterin cofactor-binding domain-containing protein [Gaiellaceae bacterium]